MEESLHPTKQVLLWLEQAKAAGSYLRYWKQELMGPMVPVAWAGTPEAFFLYAMVNEINLAVVRETPPNRKLVWFAAGALEQIIWSRRNQVPLDSWFVSEWRDRFAEMVADTLALEAAAAIISRNYFEGLDVLFPDTKAELKAQADELREMVRLHNGVAPALNVAPIAIEEFAPGHPRVDARVAEFVSIARAEVLARQGELDAAVDALYPS